MWHRIFFLFSFGSVTGLICGQIPLKGTHIHNDYLNNNPLVDALSLGFLSVEADVFRVGDELILAHVTPFGKNSKTLDKYYLDPLLLRVREINGFVYKNSAAVFTLMIEFKTSWEETYPVLLDHLIPYREMLYHWEGEKEFPGPVKILITGNKPPLEKLKTESIRWASLDGNPGNLNENISNAYIPRISLSWRGFSSWRGKGDIPEADQTKLVALAQECELQGKELRFWASPQNNAFWKLFSNVSPACILQADKPGHLARFFSEKSLP